MKNKKIIRLIWIEVINICPELQVAALLWTSIYQFAFGARKGPPKVDNMDSFLDLVRNPPEGYGFVKEFYRS